VSVVTCVCECVCVWVCGGCVDLLTMQDPCSVVFRARCRVELKSRHEVTDIDGHVVEYWKKQRLRDMSGECQDCGKSLCVLVGGGVLWSHTRAMSRFRC
jgi:hypothetical protein